MIVRRSIAIACVVAAVWSASAIASTHALWVFRHGTQTASRTGAGCTFHAVSGDELVTTCGARGHAVLTYSFGLPPGVGSVYPKVDGWQWCSGQHWLQAVMARVNARTVHEVIPVPAGCKVAINSVRIVYFSRR